MLKFSGGIIAITLNVALALTSGLSAQESPVSSMGIKGAEDPQATKDTTIPPHVGFGWKSETGQFFTDLVHDQKDLWISPTKLKFSDTTWLVPLSGFTAGLFVTDTDVSRHLSRNPSTLSHYNTASNVGLAAMVGGAGGMWLLSHVNHNQHWRETGLLAGEAAIQSFAMTEALKYSFRRERPNQSNGSGDFFQSGGTSFPSEHSAAAWSIAGVLTHEYPGPLVKILAYGAASFVSYSRVRSQNHFPSDVAVGTFLGMLAARQVYNKHHDEELGGEAWNNPSTIFYDEGQPRPGFIGSPYVPLDSWIYPAIERLAGMGLVKSSFLGMRPWTRLACSTMIAEAQDRLDDPTSPAADLVSELESEFLPELGGGAERGETTAKLESIYLREENISGTPLTDGYNFGQTIVNDFGRPFEEGNNIYTGASGYASTGPFSFYLRGEYQHTPFASGAPQQVQQAIADQLGVRAAPATDLAEINRARIVEGYVSLAIKGVQISFGKQALTWGPTETGSLIWSTNAEPIPMFRLSTPTPFRLPSILGWLGPMRTEFFLGQLDGHQYIVNSKGLVGPTQFDPQPFIHGLKISFKLTPDMELGFSRTVIFSGLGHPFTFGNFWKSLSAFSTNSRNDTSSNDAGDRRVGFDFSFRVPKLTKYLTLYTDSFCDDDPSPLGDPSRCAWSPGFYLSHLPGLSKLDFRAEGVTTDVSGFQGSGINYTNFVYPSGYTNKGNILGSWVGREGQGVQLSSTYWFSPQNKIQLQFRHQGVNSDFLQGGWLDDISLRTDFMLRPELALSASTQYEKWNFPLLVTETKSNVAVSISLTYRPKWGFNFR